MAGRHAAADGESADNPKRRWLTTKAIMVPAAALALGTLTATAVLAVPEWIDGPGPSYRVSMLTNMDQISNNRGDVVGGSYIIPADISQLGAAPNHADACVGRYAWAHSHGGIDADSTTVLVRVTNISANLAVQGVSPVVAGRGLARHGSYVTCPGRGGTTSLPSVNIDLDSSPPLVKAFDKHDAPSPLYLTVPRGQSRAFLLFGQALRTDVKWTARLHLQVDGHARTVTLDNHGRPFETSSSLAEFKHPYRWLGGQWQTMAWETSTGNPPAGPACRTFSRPDAKEILHRRVHRGQDSPYTSTNGASGERVKDSDCGYTARSDGTGTLPSTTLMLEKASTRHRAEKEYQAQVAGYEQHGELRPSHVHGDIAYGRGLLLRRIGRHVINLQAYPDPRDVSKRLHRVGRRLRP